MNSVNIIGRLTRDPELKFGATGTAYSRFSIAVNRKTDKDKVDFFNCVAFKKTAEIIGEYFRKGNLIGITGSLQTNEYEVNGEKKKNVDIFVENITFLEKKKITEEIENSENVENIDDEFPF